MAEWRQIEKSENIYRIRYFRKQQLLLIHFKDKQGLPASLYAYSKVPWSRYMGLLKAKSKGGYHARFIRRKYDYQLIDPSDARRLHLVA